MLAVTKLAYTIRADFFQSFSIVSKSALKKTYVRKCKVVYYPKK